MNTHRLWSLLALLTLSAPSVASAQSVVVDEGTFEVEIAGVVAGTETFSIRRTGIGRSATYFSTGVIQTTTGDTRSEIRPLLRTSGDEGVAVGYQVKITAEEALEVVINLAPPRYLARFTSSTGQEEREFRARADTRIVDAMVAHQFHFLAGVNVGDVVPVIEPTSRRDYDATVEAAEDVALEVGPVTVQARRVRFVGRAGVRVVWFNRQGFVLRVEVPDLGYAAQRTDLVS